MLKPFCLLGFLLVVPTVCLAGTSFYHPAAYAQANNAEVESAIRWVKSKHNGRVLSAKSVRTDTGRMIRVKLLTAEGVVKVIFVKPGG